MRFHCRLSGVQLCESRSGRDQPLECVSEEFEKADDPQIVKKAACASTYFINQVKDRDKQRLSKGDGREESEEIARLRKRTGSELVVVASRALFRGRVGHIFVVWRNSIVEFVGHRRTVVGDSRRTRAERYRARAQCHRRDAGHAGAEPWTYSARSGASLRPRSSGRA